MIVEPHEQHAAQVFTAMGLNVEFLLPSRTKGAKTADVQIAGVEWEIKSPTGTSRQTIQRQIIRAARQSHNVIIDLRRCKLPQRVLLVELVKQLELHRSIQRLKVITKSGNVLDLKP